MQCLSRLVIHALALEADSADERLHGDVLRVVLAPGVAVQEVAVFLEKSGIQKFTLNPEVEPVEQRLSVGPGAGFNEYAAAYVNEFAGDLDKFGLMHVFRGITDAV
jgi:VIT1/CCC1 family predicted Fe2+/Mn2+ transporter